MATKISIEDDLRTLLDADPRLPYPEQVAVSAEGDEVTLRGAVGSFSQRRAAVSDGHRVAGVKYVFDQLEVRLMRESRRTDAVLRGVALQALAWDHEAPTESIDADVADGWVTLSGDVSYQFESDAAYQAIAVLSGVVGVTNEIKVVNPLRRRLSAPPQPTGKDRPMLDDAYGTENVIAVSFRDDNAAYAALTRLKELDSQGQVSVKDAAVVARGDDGRIVEKDRVGGASFAGTATGGVVGLLIGVLAGPLGILVGGATGVLLGSLFDLDDADDTDSVLGEISKSIGAGPAGLLADVTEQSADVVDTAMQGLGGMVLRRSVDDVEAEIAAAEQAQRAAKKKARKELSDARHKKHKDDVDAKVAELKAKLHPKKHAATSA